MATKVLKTSGAWNTAANWEPSGVPAFGDDVEVPAGKEAKIETTIGKCRSILIAGTLAGTVKLEIGNSELPNGPAGEGVALKVAAGATVTGFALQYQLVSTYTAGALSINVDKSVVLKGIVKQDAENTKYRLGESLATSKEIAWEGKGSELNLNAKKLEAEKLQFNATSQIFNCENSETVLTLALAVNVFVAPKEGTVLATGSTLSLTGKGAKLEGRNFTYGTVKLKAGNIEIKGSDAIMDLILETAGLEATKIAVGALITLTALEVLGTSEGSHAKLASGKAAEKAKIHLPATTESTAFLGIRDIEAETNSLYLPNGTDETANVNIFFEKAPGGGVVGKATGAILLTGTATATVNNVVSGKATGPLLLTGASQATIRAVVSGKATGTLLLTGTSTGQTASRVTAKSTGSLLLTGTGKGSVAGNVVGKATGALTFTGTAKAVSTLVLPHLPGTVAPRERTGLTAPASVTRGLASPSQHAAVSAPRQRVGTSSPTQRTGNG